MSTSFIHFLGELEQYKSFLFLKKEKKYRTVLWNQADGHPTQNPSLNTPLRTFDSNISQAFNHFDNFLWVYPKKGGSSSIFKKYVRTFFKQFFDSELIRCCYLVKIISFSNGFRTNPSPLWVYPCIFPLNRSLIIRKLPPNNKWPRIQR